MGGFPSEPLIAQDLQLHVSNKKTPAGAPRGSFGTAGPYRDGRALRRYGRVVRRVPLDRVALLALDADGHVAGDGHAVQAAGEAVVVVDGVVLGDAVVEEDELVRRPAVAQDVLRAGDVRLEQVQDLAGLGDRQADDPLREPADEQTAFTGQRVDTD